MELMWKWDNCYYCCGGVSWKNHQKKFWVGIPMYSIILLFHKVNSYRYKYPYSEIINWLLVWMQQGGSNFYNEFGRILLQIKNSPEKLNNEVDS